MVRQVGRASPLGEEPLKRTDVLGKPGGELRVLSLVSGDKPACDPEDVVETVDAGVRAGLVADGHRRGESANGVDELDTSLSTEVLAGGSTT